LRVLIVDDAPFMVESFQDIFEDEGWEVVGTASNGREAIRLFTQMKPDIVIMDILMPEMDGLSAIKEIIRNDKKAKIIVVSALAKKDLDTDCLEAGAKVFIKKPFDIDLLIQQMKRTHEAGP